jgi:hypothetical protein
MTKKSENMSDNYNYEQMNKNQNFSQHFDPKNIPEGFYEDESGQLMKRECSCGKKNQEVDSCEGCNPKPPAGMLGWICPVCGRGMSPFSSSCPCKTFNQSFPQYPVTINSQIS